jgi:NAD(P)H-dependent FMN reductase
LNSALLQCVAGFLPAEVDLDILQPQDVKLPLFNQDLEAEPAIREEIERLHGRFRAASGFLIASPEYNGQVTPWLKNLVDWVSRLPWIDERYDSAFVDRPTLLCSASTGGSGGSVGIPSARALFGYVGCAVLGGSICVPYAQNCVDPFGFTPDPALEAHIAASTARFMAALRGHALARNEMG